uniref:Clathrin/coatomer adaptor adaptin-like N-terminal domain-containing protein n=1 Tax=Populus alba TaxID=43335 RepID=A0A4U5M4G6_POPAL|nr:hypothetical protein D5086_0000323180 [Populus alba]
MVIFEAARAITELSGVTSRELTPAITVLQLFLSSSKPVLRFAAVRNLNKVAMTHPMAVTNCNIDMESLISDQNRSIATLAITTLLKTGMNQVTVFEVSPEVQIIDELFKQHSQGGNEYKKAIVDSIVILIRDIPEAKESEGSAVDGASHIRHLNLVSRGDDEAALTAVDAKKLRTVFSMVDVLNGPWKFKSLRTLKLRRSDITELPDSICKLRHLRYLDVSDTAIRALPESITKLYHLETLRFTDCKSLEKLPQKVRNLVSLRHLHFDDPKLVPAEVRLLTRLQTLLIFAVGPDHMVEELGCLKELRGALKICKLEQVIRESSTQTGDRPFYDFLESCLRHKAEMVIFEAARAITQLSGVTSRELTPAITVLQVFLSSSKPVLRFAAVRNLNKVAMTHPMAVTNCNIDMESLISDQNRSIATLAITTLLKTGMNQVWIA